MSVAGVRRIGEDVSFTLRIHGERAAWRLPPGLAIPLSDYRTPYRVEDHVRIQDDQGQASWWNAGSLQNLAGGGLEVMVTVHGGRGGPPARLLYHNVVGTALELIFEFTDLPLP